MSVQGNNSGCVKPLVDTKTNVAFKYKLLIFVLMSTGGLSQCNVSPCTYKNLFSNEMTVNCCCFPGGHAGEHHDPEGQQLEVSGEDGGALGVDHVLARQGPLHDDLK